MDEARRGRPPAADRNAKSESATEPAFIARPDGAPVYHGFVILDDVVVDGFTLGKITDWEAEPCQEGDAFVIAPDGSRQYFVNSSAESAHFVVDALRVIGAPQTADICQRAITAAFPSGLPESEEAIRSAAADFSDEVLENLEPLDQEFFSYPHNLTELLFAYVSHHPAEFGELPKPDGA